MLEILHFYVSGFWIWLGITLGLVVVFDGISTTIRNCLKRKEK